MSTLRGPYLSFLHLKILCWLVFRIIQRLDPMQSSVISAIPFPLRSDDGLMGENVRNLVALVRFRKRIEAIGEMVVCDKFTSNRFGAGMKENDQTAQSLRKDTQILFR